MKVGVYHDGDLIKTIELDVQDRKSVEQVLMDEFDWEEGDDYEYEIDEEVYIGVNECEYLWVEKV